VFFFFGRNTTHLLYTANDAQNNESEKWGTSQLFHLLEAGLNESGVSGWA